MRAFPTEFSVIVGVSEKLVGGLWQMLLEAMNQQLRSRRIFGIGPIIDLFTFHLIEVTQVCRVFAATGAGFVLAQIGQADEINAYSIPN